MSSTLALEHTLALERTLDLEQTLALEQTAVPRQAKPRLDHPDHVLHRCRRHLGLAVLWHRFSRSASVAGDVARSRRGAPKCGPTRRAASEDGGRSRRGAAKRGPTRRTASADGG